MTEYITRKEVEKILHCKTTKATEIIKKHEGIWSFKITKSWLVDKEKFEEWLKDQLYKI